MTLGSEILSGDSFEKYKSQIDVARTTEDLAKIVASIENPFHRAKVMYAATRRHNLMLERRIEELSKSNK